MFEIYNRNIEKFVFFAEIFPLKLCRCSINTIKKVAPGKKEHLFGIVAASGCNINNAKRQYFCIINIMKNDVGWFLSFIYE